MSIVCQANDEAEPLTPSIMNDLVLVISNGSSTKAVCNEESILREENANERRLERLVKDGKSGNIEFTAQRFSFSRLLSLW